MMHHHFIAKDVVPFTLQINDEDPRDIETEADLLGASQAIVEAMDSIPKGGPEPTKPKDVAVTIEKDGARIDFEVRFLDVAIV
jgi:hypothetical protein